LAQCQFCFRRDALEKLRKLPFAEPVPEPARQMLLPIETTEEDNDAGED
jgi:hypothetical protein